MSDEGKVIFLAFSSEKVTSQDTRNEFLTCLNCSNKAWTLRYSNISDYPELFCTCCSGSAGLVGFVTEDEVEE